MSNERDKMILHLKEGKPDLKAQSKYIEKKFDFVKDIENATNLFVKSAIFENLSKTLFMYGYKKGQQDLIKKLLEHIEANKKDLNEKNMTYENAYNELITAIKEVEK